MGRVRIQDPNIRTSSRILAGQFSPTLLSINIENQTRETHINKLLNRLIPHIQPLIKIYLIPQLSSVSRPPKPRPSIQLEHES